MKCSEIRELLSLYIDNMLEESLIDEVAAHIAACPECKSEYEELIAMTRMLKELPETKLPSDFDRRLHEALSAQTPEAAAENEYQVVRYRRRSGGERYLRYAQFLLLEYLSLQCIIILTS